MINPDTLPTLIRAFARLDDLLPDARYLWITEETISFEYGRDVGYCGAYETEWERVRFTWEEFLDENGDGSSPSIETMCRTQWDAIRAERAVAERRAKEEREKAEVLERAELDRLAPLRKRERELKELHELMAAYPDEVKNAVLARLDAATTP